MYSLLTTINNRRQWICELTERVDPNTMPEFVVEFDRTNVFNVFSIKTTDTLICFQENGYDLPVKDLQVDFSASENEITISLSQQAVVLQNEVTPAPRKKSFFDSLAAEEEQNRQAAAIPPQQKIAFDPGSQDISFVCTHSAAGIYLDAKVNRLSENFFDLKNILIHIRFGNFSKTIKIDICHPRQFLGVALDFGSEASQLAVSAYQQQLNNPAMPVHEDLFENIKNLMISKQLIAADTRADFYQEEKGTRFFKSIFFVKSDLGNVDTLFNTEKFLRNPEENLKMLVDKSSGKSLTQDDNKHYQFPNLKIIHGHHDLLEDIKFRITKNNYPASIHLNYVAEKVHNSVLMRLLESYIQKDFALNEMERFVRITLLVPNIYDSESVRVIQHNIREILAGFQQNHIGHLAGYEVLTISESDAALIGYMSKPESSLQAGKQYIVIDAGKGTTDYSVVKTGQEDLFKIVPVYRNGFAGAGNLITNAIFETLIHFIRQQHPDDMAVQQAIRTKILEPLKNDLAVRNEFFNELEKLKKKFSENQKVISQWQQASSGSIKLKDITESGVDINTIIDILKQIENVADFYQYIEVAIETITEKVISSLEILRKAMPEIQYQGAIMTGRGFLFQPLQKRLEQKLNNRLGVAEQHIFRLRNNELKDVCIKGVFNRSMQVNSEVIGYPIQKIKTPATAHSPGTTQTAKQKLTVYDRVKKLLGSIEGEETTYIFSQNNALKASQLRNSTFQIGAKSYSIPNDEHFYDSIQPRSEIKIEYTSEGYVLRHLIDGKVIRINALQNTFELADIDKHTIIPSLFPNYIDTDYLESMQADIRRFQTNEAPPIPPQPSKPTFDELKF